MTEYDLCPECGYESFHNGFCYECGYNNLDERRDDDYYYDEDELG